MKTSALLSSDIRANRRNPKGLLLCVLYRIAHSFVDCGPAMVPVRIVVVFFYKLATEYVLGTEIHWRATIGPGLAVYHGYGLVVSSHARIGANAVLRHGITIGIKTTNVQGDAPVIGDDVDIGASAIILGPIRIGNRVTVGAGAVVIKDVPDDGVVVGNPGRLVVRTPPAAPGVFDHGESDRRAETRHDA